MAPVEFALKHYFNIETRNADGSFRDLYDILKDASKIYWGLEESQKDLLKDLFLGKRGSKSRFEEYMN